MIDLNYFFFPFYIIYFIFFLTVLVVVERGEGLSSGRTEIGLFLNLGVEGSFLVLGDAATRCEAVSSVSGLEVS